MPQNPNQVYPALNGGVAKPLNVDAQGALEVANNGVAAKPLTLDANNVLISGNGVSSALNLSASTVVKAGPGRLVRVNVITAGAAGTINDCLTTGAAAAGNEIAVIPATVGTYVFDWPCLVGIVYVPGSAQVVSISFD